MKTSKIIFKAIQELKQAGYNKVSLHELAWHTKLNKEQLLASLRSTGHEMTTQDGESFVFLTDNETHFSRLPAVDKYNRLVGA